LSGLQGVEVCAVEWIDDIRLGATSTDRSEMM